jgi:hypothetical protein
VGAQGNRSQDKAVTVAWISSKTSKKTASIFSEHVARQNKIGEEL